MIRFLLKNTIRNIVGNFRFSLINTIGLVIGISTFILIMSWVKFELSFDNFNQDQQSIFRVTTITGAETPNAMAVALQNDIPEVRLVARYQLAPVLTFKIGDEVFYENKAALADPSFFQLLNYPFRVGNAEKALASPYNIVLTQRMADKYFKGENPVGKTILVENKLPAKVTGILKDPPPNSHLQFDCVIPFVVLKEFGFDLDSWYNWNPNTYVRLDQNADLKEVQAKIQALADSHRTNNKEVFVLQQLKDIHFNTKLDFDHAITINPYYIYILSIGSFLILIISIINYVNLSLSLYNQRLKSIGVKQTLGASKNSLIKQIFVDTFVVVLVSFMVSFLLVSLVNPIYKNFLGGEVRINLFSLESLAGFLILAILIAVVSSSYPSWLMTSLNPTFMLNNKKSVSGRGFPFREVSVVVQFALSALLITGAIGISKQLHFMNHEDLGFDRDNVVYVRLNSNSESKYRNFSEELSKNANIESVSLINHAVLGFNETNGSLKWQGQQPGEKLWVGTSSVDYNYFDLMGFRLADGRNFSEDLASDKKNTVIINETLAKRIRYPNPVGKTIKYNGRDLQIVGVLKDAHLQSLHKAIEPQIYRLVNFERDIEYKSTAVVKYKFSGGHSASIAPIIKNLEKIWKEIYPEFPFNYTFLNQAVEDQYQAEQKLNFLMYIFSGLSIFLSCLGLFALSSLIVQKRTKEIGIRKVNGAKTSEVLAMLNIDFVRWVVFAFVISTPIAYFVINEWLENFAYKTTLSWWIFVLSGVVALGVALLSVSWQSWRAATRNPVEALRYE